MRLRLYIQTFIAVSLFTLVLSCGGGGDSASTGGIGGTGFTGGSFGAVQGFGSVFINEVEFETFSAEFEIEGVGGFFESDLHEGMVVIVEGTFDDNGVDGSATKIKYDDNLKGPISSVSTSAQGLTKTLVVMAQTIIVEDGVTRFDDSDLTFTFASLGAGNIGSVIEVSGFTNFDGSIRATYVKKKADDLPAFLAGNDLEIMGTVSAANFNPPNSFEINGLTIDYSGVTPRNGTIAIGVLVEIKGNSLVGNTFSATDVEIKPVGLGIDDAEKAEMEGFINNLNVGAKTFKVNGQIVSYAIANFVGGTEAELLDGIKVEAEGPISGGILQAFKIEFEDSVKFEANAVNVNAGAGTLTLEGFPGITIQADDITEFDGVAGLGGISPGNNLKIRGRRSTPTSTTVIAMEIELVNVASDDRTIIQGTVDSFVAFSSVTIIGVVVDTSTIEDDDFKDDDTIIGEAAFYNRLGIGDLVKARLDLSTGDWDQIEFEN